MWGGQNPATMEDIIKAKLKMQEEILKKMAMPTLPTETSEAARGDSASGSVHDNDGDEDADEEEEEDEEDVEVEKE